MIGIIDTKSSRRLSAKLMAGLAIAAFVAVGSVAAPADARDYSQQNLPYGYGGYYAAPPAAYGWPYGYGYYAQPYGYYGRPYYGRRAFYGR
jgi:hypothetical protein